MATSVFVFNDGQATNLFKKITGNSVVDVIDATTGQINVPWFRVSENAGSTPNLTVELYDIANTTSYYLGDAAGSTWVAKAVTAKQSVAFTDGYVVATGWKLRVTSNDAAGKFDITGIKIGKGRPAK